jgi:anti-anti-sigma factor
MATTVEPIISSVEATSRMLGESTAVVATGAWFSAVTSAAFADTVSQIHEAGAREIVLDLTAIRAMDSAGTATLGALAEQLDVVGCELAIATTHPGLVAWLTTVPLDVALPVFETVEDALADLLRRPV